jgi:putative transposase
LFKTGERYLSEKQLLTALFHEHKGRYGYRRIKYALRRLGVWLNHKTVQRLMRELGLKSCVRPKRYKSYQGEVGHTAPNLLNRHFEASRPNEKWVTDVTQFTVHGQKIYLSPVIDLFNQEVVAYEVAKSAHLPLVTNMLNKAIKTLKPTEKPIVHSDQGWQYQNFAVRKELLQHGLTQSMSRKGNCLDNAVAENFFGLLKTEMYHGVNFDSADELIRKLKDYIEYYNTKRIKVKLKGLTPVEFREQALLAV